MYYIWTFSNILLYKYIKNKRKLKFSFMFPCDGLYILLHSLLFHCYFSCCSVYDSEFSREASIDLQFLDNYDTNTHAISLHTTFFYCAKLKKWHQQKQNISQYIQFVLFNFILWQCPSYSSKSAKLLTFW